MADAYEVFLTLDLRDDLSEAELAEVRWHLGLGPQPEQVTIVTTTYPVPADDGSWPEVPLPVLAGKDTPPHVGGVEVAVLARRDGWPSFGITPGWAITARQEVHVDGIEDLQTFVEWLAQHTEDPGAGPGTFIGYLRRFDAHRPSFITMENHRVDWPYYT